MTPRPRRPSTNSIIRTDKVFARVNRIVSVRLAPDQLIANISPPIAAQVVGAQRIREACRGRGVERRWKGARRALGEECDTGLEAKRESLGYL